MGLGDVLKRFRPSRPDPEDVARIKAWVREIAALPDGAEITVSEIACTDPACPGLETIILIMRPDGPTRAAKARGSILVQTRPDIVRALAEVSP